MEDSTEALATTSNAPAAPSGDGATQAVAVPGTPRTSFSEKEVSLVKRTICQGSTDEELSLFLQQCKRTGLDPFSNQIHAVFRWDSREKREVMQIQTGIDGYRLIAERTGLYDGQGPVEWCGNDGRWQDVWLSHNVPAAARVTVYRSDFSRPISAIALYDEYVATKKGGNPNYMWSKMPANMLAKCAEALAIRKAFPKDTSGVYTKEEMQQAQNSGQSAGSRPEQSSTQASPAPAAKATVVKEAPTQKPKIRSEKYERGLAILKERMQSARDLRATIDRCFEHAEEEWGWGDDRWEGERMQGLIDAARDVQLAAGVAPAEVYIPGQGQADAFEQADAGAGGFQQDLEALGAGLEKAMEYETLTARRQAATRSIEKMRDRHPEPSEDERDQIMAVYEPVRAELAGAAEQAEAQEHDPLVDGPALSPEEMSGSEDENEAEAQEGRTPLPEGFPHREKLAPDYTTAEGVMSAGRIEGKPALTDLGGIGESYAEEIKGAAERLIETGDHRAEGVKRQDEDLPY